MSQAKVDRYKEEKKNRQQIMKKQKREWFLTKTVLAAIAVVVVGWFGFSIYQNVTATPEAETVQVESFTVNTSALTDYVNGLSED